ncbi:hypothetical protein [Carboxydothermus pertinax]|uniref:Uncharacterized protein n=1 Tax=Carboxydothermus pertinax TaxID=870242 RepID=A0A1L8CVU4_9THEO|nr:hypothetical protein [Carboxydothermus pertinax]GAV23030.1 hypothetical protein cpu_15400 [Carboxydothermus pertinax]
MKKLNLLVIVIGSLIATTASLSDRISKAIGVRQDIVIYFDILLFLFAIFLLVLNKRQNKRD